MVNVFSSSVSMPITAPCVVKEKRNQIKIDNLDKAIYIDDTVNHHTMK